MPSDINTPLTEFSTTKYHPLGYKFENGQDTYRYAYNAGADTLTAGEILGSSQTTPQYGYLSGTAADITDGTSSTSVPMGMAMSAAPTANYFWCQTGGPNRKAITTDGNITEGDMWGFAGTTSPDGTILPIADGTEENAGGVALKTDTGTTSAVGEISIGCEKFW